MPLLDVAAAKEQLNIKVDDATHDDELAVFVAAVDEVIEGHTRVVPAEREVTERHEAGGYKRKLVLRKRPVASITSLEAIDGGQAWDLATLDVDELGVVRDLAGGYFRGDLVVVYQAGYTDAEIPDHFVLAARIILQHLWETQRGKFGAPRAGGMADSMGSPGRAIGAGYAIPNAALELLGPKPPVVA